MKTLLVGLLFLASVSHAQIMGGNAAPQPALTAENIPAGTLGPNVIASSVAVGAVGTAQIAAGANITGNAATVTTNANLTGDVTSAGNATTAAATQSHIVTLSGLKVISSATTATSTITLTGINDGSDVGAGFVGEFISSNPAVGVAWPASNTAVAVATITLTAGDWEISGNCDNNTGATSAVSSFFGGLSTVNTTWDNRGNNGYGFLGTVPSASSSVELHMGPRRLSTSAGSTPVYLICGQVDTVIGGGKFGTFNYIGARRIR